MINQGLRISIPLLSDFECQIDGNGRPSVAYKEKKHVSLSSLLRDAPWLLEAKNLKVLASAANFFFKGIEFDYIEDIEKFKQMYQEHVKNPISEEKPLPFQLVDFGVFDVSSMCDPYLDLDSFIFYVKNNYNQLPYRVSCSYLIQGTSNISYELLPRLGST